jgi:hypothetical protein
MSAFGRAFLLKICFALKEFRDTFVGHTPFAFDKSKSTVQLNQIKPFTQFIIPSIYYHRDMHVPMIMETKK